MMVGKNSFESERKRLEILQVVGYIILSHTCVSTSMDSCDVCHVNR